MSWHSFFGTLDENDLEELVAELKDVETETFFDCIDDEEIAEEVDSRGILDLVLERFDEDDVLEKLDSQAIIDYVISEYGTNLLRHFSTSDIIDYLENFVDSDELLDNIRKQDVLDYVFKNFRDDALEMLMEEDK